MGFLGQMASSSSVASSFYYCSQSFLCPLSSSIMPLFVFCFQEFVEIAHLLTTILFPSSLLSCCLAFYLSVCSLSFNGRMGLKKGKVNVCGQSTVLRRGLAFDFTRNFPALSVYLRKHLLIFYVLSLLRFS